MLETGKVDPFGHKKNSGHAKLYIKLFFNRKSRHVLGGHMNPSPYVSACSGVAWRESVRISFTRIDLKSRCLGL